MPNHLHLIISTTCNNLSDIIKDFKKNYLSKILKSIELTNNESRRSSMLWIIKKASENNEQVIVINFGNKIIIQYYAVDKKYYEPE